MNECWVRLTPCTNIPPREDCEVVMGARHIAVFNLGPENAETIYTPSTRSAGRLISRATSAGSATSALSLSPRPRPILRARVGDCGPMNGRPSVLREHVNPDWRQADVDEKPDHLPIGTSVSSTRQAA